MRRPENKNRRDMRGVHVRIRKCRRLCGVAVEHGTWAPTKAATSSTKHNQRNTGHFESAYDKPKPGNLHTARPRNEYASSGVPCASMRTRPSCRLVDSEKGGRCEVRRRIKCEGPPAASRGPWGCATIVVARSHQENSSAVQKQHARVLRSIKIEL